MQYKGIELVEITEPQIFDPPKKMLAWGNGIEEPRESLVVAVLPENCQKENRIIGIGVFSFAHCAEIPKEPKPRRATNRELSKWLAQGNGECTDYEGESAWVSSSRSYTKSEREKSVDNYVRVCKWDDTEWHEPTVDYMGLEVSDAD